MCDKAIKYSSWILGSSTGNFCNVLVRSCHNYFCHVCPCPCLRGLPVSIRDVPSCKGAALTGSAFVRLGLQTKYSEGSWFERQAFLLVAYPCSLSSMLTVGHLSGMAPLFLLSLLSLLDICSYTHILLSD